MVNFPKMLRISLVILLLSPCALLAQKKLASTSSSAPSGVMLATAGVATATRAAAAPVIDGKEDDAVWAEAPVIEGFRQFAPKEDAAPSFRTTAKIAYDDRFLYVFVRMYDPHPDSIVGMLSRHDVKTQSDWIKLIIDSYHDKRTGYEFAVNPRGVKRDYYTYNDETEDESWDGVWDVETRIDSAGWTAEFRIPFDQLRFSKSATITMGFGIWRDIARLDERDSWPLYRNSANGIASQLGEINGIEGLGAPRHLELMPYVVTKNITYTHVDSSYTHQQQVTAGADVKYGLTSNLTLDGTINPDFGQVESDPAVLNLSNFETFLPEKRPFFVEGTGIFRFDMACNNGSCSGLFYSRRIGRQPQLADGLPGSPTTTSIIGAAKLTGRTAGGLSVGVLDAYTQRENNAPDSLNVTYTAEPATNYFASQVLQEFRGGQSNVGLMVTAVNRQNDAYTANYLRDAAYTSGLEFHHQFADRTYQLAGYVIGSYVTGTDSAIMYTQTSSAHYYQRPGSGLDYDPSRTSLSGDAEKVALSKINGGVVRWWTAFMRVSPGFEPNDFGYLQLAGTQQWSNWFGLQYLEPTSWYRQLFVNFNETNNWTTQGLSGTYLSGTNANANVHLQLKNSWMLTSGLDYNQFFGVFDPTKARGGPAMFRHPFTDAFIEIDGDPRLKAIPTLYFDAFDGSGGKSHGWDLSPSVLLQFSSSLRMSLGLSYGLNIDYQQWVDNGVSANLKDTVYTIATLNQYTMSATIRIDATFTPRLSLQFYAQPFISDGHYDTWRQVVNPRATDYNVQYAPFDSAQAAHYPSLQHGTIAGYDFADQQLNVNTVLRWEYRRGSALYLVWTHGRTFENTSQAYQGFSPGADVDNLFGVHPMNTFLIKATYWMGL